MNAERASRPPVRLPRSSPPTHARPVHGRPVRKESSTLPGTFRPAPARHAPAPGRARVLIPWRYQTQGLVAPDAPTDGHLTANGTGWVVGSGGPGQRLLPRTAAVINRAGLLMVCGPLLAVALSGWRPAPLAVALATIALPLVAGRQLAYWAGRLGLRRMGRTPLVRHPGEAEPGALIRLRGVVVARPAVPSLFRGRPSVLFRNRVSVADETRGIDFELRLDCGDTVSVSTRAAVLLERPARITGEPACGPVAAVLDHIGSYLRLDTDGRAALLGGRPGRARLYEASVGPGDRIEVCGHLDLAPSPHGEHRPGRGIPLGATLRAHEGIPLLVRALRAADGLVD
jgi:hypothetical protein